MKRTHRLMIITTDGWWFWTSGTPVLPVTSAGYAPR